MAITKEPAVPAATPHVVRIPAVLDALSLLLVAVMVTTSGAGLFLPHVYRDNPWSTAAFQGTDAVTLFVVVPVLLGAVLLARRGSKTSMASMAGRLVWLGVLAYNVYNYAFYVFGTAFNDFFLLYAAGMGISLVLLVFAVPPLLGAVSADAHTPFRLIGGYLVLVGAMFGALWVTQSLDYVVTGRLPQLISDSGTHTSIVFALDLTLVVPWMVIGGVLMWRRSNAGVALGVVMNVLAVLYMTALAVSGVFLADAGVADTSWTDPPYLQVGIASLIVLILLLPRLRSGGDVTRLTDRGSRE